MSYIIREDLLEKELRKYRDEFNTKPIKFNRNYIYNLFRKYKMMEFCEDSYCCYGEETCCWQEPIGDGIWMQTQKQAEGKAWREILKRKHFLRRRKDGDRLFKMENNDTIIIYFYGRDLECMDDIGVIFKKK